MKPAPSSASFSIGSSVPFSVASPVVLVRSLIRIETGSCSTGGGGPCAAQ